MLWWRVFDNHRSDLAGGNTVASSTSTSVPPLLDWVSVSSIMTRNQRVTSLSLRPYFMQSMFKTPILVCVLFTYLFIVHYICCPLCTFPFSVLHTCNTCPTYSLSFYTCFPLLSEQKFGSETLIPSVFRLACLWNLSSPTERPTFLRSVRQ